MLNFIVLNLNNNTTNLINIRSRGEARVRKRSRPSGVHTCRACRGRRLQSLAGFLAGLPTTELVHLGLVPLHVFGGLGQVLFPLVPGKTSPSAGQFFHDFLGVGRLQLPLDLAPVLHAEEHEAIAETFRFLHLLRRSQ